MRQALFPITRSSKRLSPILAERLLCITLKRLLHRLCPCLLPFVLATSAGAQATASDPQVDTGLHALGSYDGLHDNVSLMSGNVSFCIPLVSLPGAYHHDLNVPLCYNSQVVEEVNQGGVMTPSPVVSYFPWVWGSSTSHLGPGWTLTGRPITYEGPSGTPVLYMPDGAKYPIPGTTNSWGYIWGSPNIQYDAGWIYQGNGTKTTNWYGIHNNSPVTTTQEYDKDGSLITFTASSITDTAGRTVAVSAANGSGSSPAQISFQYPDSNGILQLVTVQMTTATYNCNQNQAYGAVGTWAMPTAIILPNKLTYTFQYDSCGFVNKITYPAGGYTRYVYTPENTGQWNYNSTGHYVLGPFTQMS